MQTLLVVSNRYEIRPSELIGLDFDEYLSFCFDEAALFIEQQIKNEEEPNWIDSHNIKKPEEVEEGGTTNSQTLDMLIDMANPS